MASSLMRSLLRASSRRSLTSSSAPKLSQWGSSHFYSKVSSSAKEKEKEERVVVPEVEPEVSDVPTSGISRPLWEILRELNKRVPDTLVRVRMEDGFAAKYVPWHVVNRIMNLHAPEWSGEVRSITYSADGKSVSVVYRVTLYGTDAEIYRESTGTASVNDTSYGDPVQKAEAMAFRRACARLGLGLHLYHEDLS
ncbi:DNA repair RAD52-like protein 1, mitochondrial [Macadamia integrifolia]|uniref:DNA repair RAD52-like protein 1, mitochondrial n=1 Tax=Macadamia integrifolia TaxID=60698 RepID=UPI001C530225|nr:DNA repair RAD52-like protein 1, mitochondrial [Macadamia integrifolia]